jgi:hypothetical protein
MDPRLGIEWHPGRLEQLGRPQPSTASKTSSAPSTKPSSWRRRNCFLAAKVAAASAEGEAKGLRLALEEARRPFWRRWLGP